MTRPRRLFVTVCACALLGAAAPAVAGAAWTAPQDLGPTGFGSATTSLASNDRGDAVTAFSHPGGIRIARATAGAAFGPSVGVSTDYGTVTRVAIDARGVALIAWEYQDGAVNGVPDDFRGTTTCCTGTKVIVWRPGQLPTRAHVIRRRALITRLGHVAAVSGRRGLLVQTSSFNRTSGEEGRGSLQFAPIRLDGRPGKRRNVVRSNWVGASLQFSGGRAVVGLIGQRRASTPLALRSQRASGTFGTIRVFRTVPEKIESYDGSTEFAKILMAPDGRGGQLAVMQRGRRPKQFVQFIRKPRTGRLRSITVRRGPAEDFRFSRPAASPDGWSAVAFARRPKITELDSVGYVLAVSPNGRSFVTRVTASEQSSGPAVSVTRGGTGAAGFIDGRSVPFGAFVTRASFVPLTRGLPRLPAALIIDRAAVAIDNVVMTSNRRDRARVVWEEGGRVLASRLG